MADRIAVMNSGKLLQVGPPQEIYSNPASEFVAGFVGEPAMNLIDAKLVQSEVGVQIDIGGRLIALPPAHQDSLRRFKGDQVRLGVRPSDIECLEAETRDDLLVAETLFMEPRNENVLVNAGVNDFQVFALAPNSFRPKPKSTIFLKLNEDAVHLFDPRSGDNLNRARGG